MAQKKYKKLTIEEREILFKRLSEGKQQNFIAKELCRDPSCISREIRRAGMNRRTYRPSVAEKNAKQQSLKRRRKYKLLENNDLASIIEDKLKQRWSPEQISGFFKLRFPHTLYMHVSHETIYRYIYSIEDKEHRESLINCLRQSRKRRRPRKRKGSKRTTIRDLVSIHSRPSEIEFREEPGHWEGDLIIGKDHKSAIGTLVERTTRYTIIVPFQNSHTTKEVTLGFAAALGILPSHMKKSLTYDRGTEMAGHKRFTEITGIPVFFADPYSPYQRGTNENTNGLIRDYLPKGTDFILVPDPTIKYIEKDLNLRPRKTLIFFNPNEIFTWFVNNPGKDIHAYFESQYRLVI